MQKQNFKNLRKPFPDIQVKNICAKFQVSMANGTSATSITNKYTYKHTHTQNGMKTEEPYIFSYLVLSL